MPRLEDLPQAPSVARAFVPWGMWDAFRPHPAFDYGKVFGRAKVYERRVTGHDREEWRQVWPLRSPAPQREGSE